MKEKQRTAHLCDRLLLMGFLEEVHAFTETHIETVIRDIDQEFQPPPADAAVPFVGADDSVDPEHAVFGNQYPAVLDERMLRLEKSMGSVLSILKKIVRTPATQPLDSHE